MSILSRPIAYDDLQRFREARDEQLELIEGELFVNPAPSPLHQRIVRRLVVLFQAAIIEAGIGEFFDAPLDLKLADGTIVQPDLVAVLTKRLAIITDTAIEGVPDFVVEVISPSNDFHDRVRKRDVYARYGVAEYWLVDPEARSITIFSDPQDGRFVSQVVCRGEAISVTIPGLTVDLAALFAPFSRAG